MDYVGCNSQGKVVGLPSSFKSAAMQSLTVRLPHDAENYGSDPATRRHL
jgi:hypothetical protein